MKQIRYSRKINQFRNLSRQVNELIENRQWQTMTESSKHQFRWKLNNLFSVARNFLYGKELKKILAAAAFLICIGTVNAQTFAPPTTNPFGITNAAATLILPSFADMDGDGDLDIFTSSYSGGVKYYENTGTGSSPAYTAPVGNPFGIYMPFFPYHIAPADLDDDGDLDIFTGEYYGIFKYYQNTGTASSPSFAGPITNPFGLDSALEIGVPDFADFDNDGDLDLLTTEYYGVFKYYQNTGTASSPSFAAPTTNPFGLFPASNSVAFPSICDLDNDGDYDILVGYVYGNMYYYMNLGTASVPIFSGPTLNPFGLSATAGLASPTFGDLDDDGDYDLMVGDTISFNYFENTTIGGISECNYAFAFSFSPNPSSDHILINSDENNYSVSILDAAGKLVYNNTYESNTAIVSTTSFSKGVYIIELSDGNNTSRKKLVIE